MDLAEAMEISVEAVDMFGRHVAIITGNEFFQKGKQQIKIKATQWPSGIYRINLKASGLLFSKKIIKT
ncbi:MAG: hypothetical protein GC192_03610 [Bacteroidetes bacterium]|nr:hypothetical protein [Bacteroidota bacterium]